MITNEFFSTLINTSFVNEEDHQSIVNQSNQYFEENFELMNQNNWDCNTLNSTSLLEKPFICKPLFSYIHRAVMSLCKDYNFPEDLTTSISGMWLNVSEPGGYQEIHDHTQSNVNNIFSGVYYVNVNSQSGSINFFNPLDPFYKYFPPSTGKDLTQRVTVTPENKMLLIFPSYLKHNVGVNNSNENRLSISFNVNFS